MILKRFAVVFVQYVSRERYEQQFNTVFDELFARKRRVVPLGHFDQVDVVQLVFKAQLALEDDFVQQLFFEFVERYGAVFEQFHGFGRALERYDSGICKFVLGMYGMHLVGLVKIRLSLRERELPVVRGDNGFSRVDVNEFPKIMGFLAYAEILAVFEIMDGEDRSYVERFFQNVLYIISVFVFHVCIIQYFTKDFKRLCLFVQKRTINL